MGTCRAADAPTSKCGPAEPAHSRRTTDARLASHNDGREGHQLLGDFVVGEGGGRGAGGGLLEAMGGHCFEIGVAAGTHGSHKAEKFVSSPVARARRSPSKGRCR